MTRPDAHRVRDMLEAIKDIRLTTASGRESFMADRIAQRAVLHCLAVIGECLNRMTAATRSTIASLDAPGAVGLRNVIVHEYWRIDLDLIWQTIVHDIPRLEKELKRTLNP